MMKYIMDTAIPTFFVVGLILMAGEIIIPGGIIGTFGAIAFLIASIDVWAHYGATWGMAAIVSSMCIATVMFFVEIRLMKSGPLARWFYLSQKTPPTSSKSAEGVLSGARGRAATRLNPTGLVIVNEKRYEAISREGLIEEGTEIVVVSDDPFRVVVRRAEAAE
jgi:membrane-bound ClpP family serine protease